MYQARLSELDLFTLEKKRLKRDLIDVYKHLRGGCQEDRAGLFSVVPSNRMRGISHYLKHGRFQLNMRGHFFTVKVTDHWDRLPKEIVESPSVEILNNHLDAILHNML